MLKEFFSSFALLLVLEGILPFIQPEIWKRIIFRIANQTDSIIRIIAFISMLSGLIILSILRKSEF